MVSNAAPESARWPRWMRCQSVMQPLTAEYWHIGAMTMRLGNSRVPTRSGVNSALMPISPFLCGTGWSGVGWVNADAIFHRARPFGAGAETLPNTTKYEAPRQRKGGV